MLTHMEIQCHITGRALSQCTPPLRNLYWSTRLLRHELGGSNDMEGDMRKSWNESHCTKFYTHRDFRRIKKIGCTIYISILTCTVVEPLAWLGIFASRSRPTKYGANLPPVQLIRVSMTLLEVTTKMPGGKDYKE